MSKSLFALLCIAFTCFSVVPAVTAQEPASAEPAVVLVELFTSEGCSSCPPADELLEQINGKRTADGQLIVGISEHVTYWNRLGWTDPFSAEAYTQRQNAYGARFNLDSVYTPQVVIDGREQIVGSSSRELGIALQREAQHPSSLKLKITSTRRSGSELAVSFSVERFPSEQAPIDILAVIVDDTDRSHVSSGENADRTLNHVAVARSLARVATVKSSTQQTIEIDLPSSVTANSEINHHVVLFAQSAKYGSVLGVDTTAF